MTLGNLGVKRNLANETLPLTGYEQATQNASDLTKKSAQEAIDNAKKTAEEALGLKGDGSKDEAGQDEAHKDEEGTREKA